MDDGNYHTTYRSNTPTYGCLLAKSMQAVVVISGPSPIRLKVGNPSDDPRHPRYLYCWILRRFVGITTSEEAVGNRAELKGKEPSVKGDSGSVCEVNVFSSTGSKTVDSNCSKDETVEDTKGAETSISDVTKGSVKNSLDEVKNVGGVERKLSVVEEPITSSAVDSIITFELASKSVSSTVVEVVVSSTSTVVPDISLIGVFMDTSEVAVIHPISTGVVNSFRMVVFVSISKQLRLCRLFRLWWSPTR